MGYAEFGVRCEEAGFVGCTEHGDGRGLENGGISPEELQLRSLFSEKVRFLGISGPAGEAWG